MSEEKSELRLKAEGISCPYCGAQPNEPCNNVTYGGPMPKSFHSSRYEAAKALILNEAKK